MDNSQKVILWLILSTGIILRLVNYFVNRSLWLDEASLALNLIHRGYFDLLKPMDHNQVAPVFFLWVERFFINLLGPGEYALRLFPLLCAIISLPVFYFLVNKISGDFRIAATALFLFSLSPLMIYYSAEVKQYSADVLCYLLLGYYFLDYITGVRTGRKLLLIGAGACVSVFLSNITIIILTVIFLYFLVEFISRKEINKQVVLLGIFTGGIFLFYYILFIHGHPGEAYMKEFWKSSFMPVNIFSQQFWDWIYRVVIRFITTMITHHDNKTWWIFIYDVVYLGMAVLGIVYYLKNKKRFTIYFLLAPVLIHLVLSAFQKYPVHTRLMLYLYPLVMILIATGIIYFTSIFQRASKKPYLSNIFIAVMLVIIPLGLFRSYPAKCEELKQSLQFLEEYIEQGQDVYVYYRGYAAFKYYQDIGYVKPENRFIRGSSIIMDEKGYLIETAKVAGPAWFLFSHAFPVKKGITEEDIIIEKLKKNRRLIRQFKTTGSSVYFFEGPESDTLK